MILYPKREKIYFTKILFLTSKGQTFMRNVKKTPSPTFFLIHSLIIRNESYVDFIHLFSFNKRMNVKDSV